MKKARSSGPAVNSSTRDERDERGDQRARRGSARAWPSGTADPGQRGDSAVGAGIEGNSPAGAMCVRSRSDAIRLSCVSTSASTM